MPVLSKGNLKINHTDEGQGQPVILIHSSVSSHRQWRALSESLKGKEKGHILNNKYPE